MTTRHGVRRAPQRMIPLTVIGGFLGAGKTTLLNRLLAGATGRRFAVLVNDFGALDIDGRLVAAHGGDTIALANGCVCCTIGDSLIETLVKLAETPDRFDHIVVEASGVADPARIADLAVLEPRLMRDGVVVVVDAWDVRARADDRRMGDTVVRQIKAADLIVLNKVDIAEDVPATRAWLATHTPAPVLEARRAEGAARSAVRARAPRRGGRCAGRCVPELVLRMGRAGRPRDAAGDAARRQGRAARQGHRALRRRAGNEIDRPHGRPSHRFQRGRAMADGDSRLVLLGPKPVLRSNLLLPSLLGEVFGVLADGGVMTCAGIAPHDPSVPVLRGHLPRRASEGALTGEGK